MVVFPPSGSAPPTQKPYPRTSEANLRYLRRHYRRFFCLQTPLFVCAFTFSGETTGNKWDLTAGGNTFKKGWASSWGRA